MEHGGGYDATGCGKQPRRIPPPNADNSNIAPMRLKYPPTNSDKDICLIMMGPGADRDHKLHPAIVRSYRKVRIWVPPQHQGFQYVVKERNPTAQVVWYDLDLEGCRKMLKGVSCCLLNTPSGHKQEVTFAQNFIDAAKEYLYPAGRFTHLVFSSLLQPILTGIGPHATGKLAIERLIIESGLPYTIVQVAPMMEDVVTSCVLKGARTTIPTLLDPNMCFSYINREDLGNALGRILTQRSLHYYATYQLVGTNAPASYNDIARKVTHYLGIEICPRRMFIVDTAVNLPYLAQKWRALRDGAGHEHPPKDFKNNTDVPFLDITTTQTEGNDSTGDEEDGGVALPKDY